MLYGLAGFVGALTFVLSVFTLQFMQPETDWTRHYVSEFANGRFGWIFVIGAAVHALGNLALSVGLARSIAPGAIRRTPALLFGAAAAGMLLAAVFPTDPAGRAETLSGIVHRSAAFASFPIELVALFLFSAALAARASWHRLAVVSFTTATIAGGALAWLFLATFTNSVPGVAERLALASFLVWELGASIALIRFPALGPRGEVSRQTPATGPGGR